MFSQTGVGALKPRIPDSAAVAMEWPGYYPTEALLNTLGGRAGILHGKVQSVARAELLAAVVALELCVNATQQVIIWTDCMFVVNGFARGRRRKHLSHADLWLKFLESSRRH